MEGFALSPALLRVAFWSFRSVPFLFFFFNSCTKSESGLGAQTSQKFRVWSATAWCWCAQTQCIVSIQAAVLASSVSWQTIPRCAYSGSLNPMRKCACPRCILFLNGIDYHNQRAHHVTHIHCDGSLLWLQRNIIPAPLCKFPPSKK